MIEILIFLRFYDTDVIKKYFYKVHFIERTKEVDMRNDEFYTDRELVRQMQEAQ